MKLFLSILFVVICSISFGQNNNFRIADGITWNISKQNEYYKTHTLESQAPTFYYYEVDGVWRMTNIIANLSWFHITGQVNKIDHTSTNILLFVETFNSDLNRKVPTYCVVLYPYADKMYVGDKVDCLVYYHYSPLLSKIVKDDATYQVVQYGVLNLSAEQSYLQQIQIQQPKEFNDNKSQGVSIVESQSTEAEFQSSFVIINGHYSWSEAYVDAKRRGGNLAVFETKEKWLRFVKQSNEKGIYQLTSYWISLVKTDNGWMWYRNNKYISLNYNNWHHLSRAIGRVSGDVNPNGTVGIIWEDNTFNDYLPSYKQYDKGYILEK